MWTKKSYNALFAWSMGGIQREQARKTMLDDGLTDAVARLDASRTLGDWYALTREAAETVGEKVVKEEADKAEKELNKLVGY